jgi:hypothetical protein
MAAARTLAALGALFALVACGGGTSTPPPPPPAASTDAVLSVSVAGGASPGIDHLWVTITGFAMHAEASRVLGDGDPGWVFQTLAAPVTLDLADPALSQGEPVSLLKQSVSVLGTFAQLRLLVASSDPSASVVASAQAKGLGFNDQVQYTDGAGVHVVPLEIPDLQSGLRLLSSFTLSADATTPLAIEWNAQSSLVRRGSPSGVDRFTLRDELTLYDQQLLTALGDGNLQIGGSIFDSISGQLDTTHFCTGASHAGCIHDVVASATSVSPDGRFHQEVRSVNVSASGAFLLYPLPSASLVDVVIHGGNMQTIVVRNVFVDPTGLLKPVPTALSSTATPIVPVLDTSERSVAVSNSLVPASSRVFFGQTLAGSGNGGADLPYVIASVAADPLTGRVLHAMTVPGGPLHDALFDPATQGVGVPPAFTTVTPAEGLGGCTVWTQGTLADGTSALALVPAGAASVTAPAPVRRSGFTSGTLTVDLSGTATTGADRAELIVSNDGGTVAVVDVSSQIATHGGATTIDVPSGVSSSVPAATIYGVALRTWVTGAESTTARWARTGAPVDLGSSGAATVSLNLP